MQPTLASLGLDNLATEDRLSLLDGLKMIICPNSEPITLSREVKEYLKQQLTTYRLDTLGVDDQLKIAQALWDSMDHKTRTNELSKAEKMELELRIKDLELHPENCLTWEEVKASLRSRRAKKK